ncbi:MAG: phage holin [Clostridia bacterium]|nr:phage holin [Clostridia bacterium]
MKKSTIARTVVLILALINQVLVMFGVNPLPFSDEGIYEAVTALLTVGASVWAWWKNNSFTKAAQEADKYLEQLREQKAGDEGEDLS